MICSIVFFMISIKIRKKFKNSLALSQQPHPPSSIYCDFFIIGQHPFINQKQMAFLRVLKELLLAKLGTLMSFTPTLVMSWNIICVCLQITRLVEKAKVLRRERRTWFTPEGWKHHGQHSSEQCFQLTFFFLRKSVIIKIQH